MNKTDDLLLEIGCEELPSHHVPALVDMLAATLTQQLSAVQLAPQAIHTYTGPRRLAIVCHQIPVQQPSSKMTRYGPFYDQAYDQQHNPTASCLSFARACGVTADQLTVVKTRRGQRVCATQQRTGQATLELLPPLISYAFEHLSLAYTMRWGTRDRGFLRPIHWIVLLFGEQVMNTSIFGVETGRISYGHRFLSPHSLVITHPSAYLSLLCETGYVMADQAVRRQTIIAAIQQLAGHDRALIQDALLDEITGITEWASSTERSF